MLKKNVVKIILDVSLAITFVLLMNPRVFNGLPFHEVAGIVIGIAVLVHIALNYKWVIHTVRNICDRSLSGKMRFSFLLNVLLLLSMSAIIVTGIFISKVLFPHVGGEGSHTLREIHDVFSKVTLALIGVHIAWHWQWIIGMCKKMFKTKEGNWRKGALATAVFVFVLFIGCMQWLAVNVQPNEKAFQSKFENIVAQADRMMAPPEKFHEREFPHKERHGSSHPLLVLFNHFLFWAVVIILYIILKHKK